MKKRQSLLAGGIIGLASIAAVFVLFSALVNASAQTMQHQGAGTGMGMGDMGPGMTAMGNTSQPHNGMFSGSGSSAVNNVQVTGIAVTADKEASVYLRYTGTGQAPGVVIVAHTNKMGMMSMMHGGMTGMYGMGGMQGMGMMGQGTMMGGMSTMPSSGSYPAWTNAQWQQWHSQMAQELARSNSTHGQNWHSQMMMNPTWLNSSSTATTAMPHDFGMQVGSKAVNEGWKNGTFKVKLEGDGSAYSSSDIMAMVFPLTG
jgi:hypothetical protein